MDDTPFGMEEIHADYALPHRLLMTHCYKVHDVAFREIRMRLGECLDKVRNQPCATLLKEVHGNDIGFTFVIKSIIIEQICESAFTIRK